MTTLLPDFWSARNTDGSKSSRASRAVRVTRVAFDRHEHTRTLPRSVNAPRTTGPARDVGNNPYLTPDGKFLLLRTGQVLRLDR